MLAVMLLAAVFCAAAVAKLRRPAALRAVLEAARVPFARPLAIAVPVAELGVASWLLSAAAPRIAALAALVLLIVFSAFLVALRGAEQPSSCGCFGERRDDADPRIGLLRNGALVLVAIAALLAPPGVAVPYEQLETLTAQLTVVAGACCLWACLVALWSPPLPGGRRGRP